MIDNFTHFGDQNRKKREREKGVYFHKKKSSTTHNNKGYPSIPKKENEDSRKQGIFSPNNDMKNTPTPVIYSSPRLKDRQVQHEEYLEPDLDKLNNQSKQSVDDETPSKTYNKSFKKGLINQNNSIDKEEGAYPNEEDKSPRHSISNREKQPNALNMDDQSTNKNVLKIMKEPNEEIEELKEEIDGEESLSQENTTQDETDNQTKFDEILVFNENTFSNNEHDSLVDKFTSWMGLENSLLETNNDEHRVLQEEVTDKEELSSVNDDSKGKDIEKESILDVSLEKNNETEELINDDHLTQEDTSPLISEDLKEEASLIVNQENSVKADSTSVNHSDPELEKKEESKYSGGKSHSEEYTILDETDNASDARGIIDDDPPDWKDTSPFVSRDLNEEKPLPLNQEKNSKADSGSVDHSATYLKKEKENKNRKNKNEKRHDNTKNRMNRPNKVVNRSDKQVKLPVLLANVNFDVDIMHAIDANCQIGDISNTEWAVKSFETRVILPSNTVFVKGELVVDIEYVDEQTSTIQTVKVPITWEKVIHVDWLASPEKGRECRKGYTFVTRNQDVSTHYEFSQTFTEKIEDDLRSIQFVWTHDLDSQSAPQRAVIQGTANIAFDLFQKQYIPVCV